MDVPPRTSPRSRHGSDEFSNTHDQPKQPTEETDMTETESKEPMTWCERMRQQGTNPQDWIEAQRDGLQSSAHLLNNDELRAVLNVWIAFAVDALRDGGNYSNAEEILNQASRMKQEAQSLNREQLTEELHRWVVLTLDNVGG
jgi:hypothetical protein